MISNYQQAIDFLYRQLPMFQRVGAVAYKKDLTNTLRLCEVLGNPQTKLKCVHIAGTNGKGSSSHMLASILQDAGFKTGLYTSPHLRHFTERIRMDGIPVAPAFVTDFVQRMQSAIKQIQPSFFELTVAMALHYFEQHAVDVAVIETGLGGRLDSTNVITPEVSLITNIGWDHMDLLGDTLPAIAGEKAGIIKPHIPVVISERQAAVEHVFEECATVRKAPLTFASDVYTASLRDSELDIYRHGSLQHQISDFPLLGAYQQKNVVGVLMTVDVLRSRGWAIHDDNMTRGLQRVILNTGLKGRWQVLGSRPLVVCDTGHNADGLREVVSQIKKQRFKKLFMVVGMVKDKDITKSLAELPRQAHYVFCQAQLPRALPAAELANAASAFGLVGEVCPAVNKALARARQQAEEEDMIFVGGSTFVVAELEQL
jgi:dihydrofolate synthase/folylpolyglutamate synthase